MIILMDTHSFLWFVNGSSQLSAHARAIIEDPANDKLLSMANIWEMPETEATAAWQRT